MILFLSNHRNLSANWTNHWCFLWVPTECHSNAAFTWTGNATGQNIKTNGLTEQKRHHHVAMAMLIRECLLQGYSLFNLSTNSMIILSYLYFSLLLIFIHFLCLLLLQKVFAFVNENVYVRCYCKNITSFDLIWHTQILSLFGKVTRTKAECSFVLLWIFNELCRTKLQLFFPFEIFTVSCNLIATNCLKHCNIHHAF